MTRALVAIAVAAWWGAGSARANPADLFGLGSRAAAMGGAAAAAVDDGAASYYDPAALVRGRDLRIDVGYRYADPRLSIDGRDVGVDSAGALVAAIAAPGALGPVRFAFGAALVLPDVRLTRVRALPFDQPRFVAYDNRPQCVFLAANLALQIVPGLYVGGGVTFMSRTEGELRLVGNVAVSDPEASALRSSIAEDLVAVRYPQAGVLWEATRWLALAVVYRHSFTLDLDQRLRVDASVGNPGMTPVVPAGSLAARSRSTDLFQPWQLTAGVALRLTRRLLVAYDLTYARWSEFPQPAASVQLELHLGALDPLVKLPPARAYPAPGFHDVVVPRLGVEWRAWERGAWSLDLRAGYACEPSPAPEQRGETSLLDADKHTLSAGVGLGASTLGGILLRPVALDLHAAVTVLPARAHHKDDPLDHTGDLVTDGVVPQLGAMLRTSF